MQLEKQHRQVLLSSLEDAKKDLDLVFENKREEAMFWFYGLSSLRKTQLCDTNTEIVGHVRRWETLTGREIEKIYENEKINSITS